jgi:flagellar biosynthesis/type III secretory pathway protein FliH
MNTQPTPETDAEHARFPMGGFTLDFARKLERERDEARFQLASSQADQDNDTQAKLAAWEMHGKAIRERDGWKAAHAKAKAEMEKWLCIAAQYKAERDALQDELIRITDTKRPSRETSNKLDLTP